MVNGMIVGVSSILLVWFVIFPVLRKYTGKDILTLLEAGSPNDLDNRSKYLVRILSSHQSLRSEGKGLSQN